MPGSRRPSSHYLGETLCPVKYVVSACHSALVRWVNQLIAFAQRTVSECFGHLGALMMFRTHLWRGVLLRDLPQARFEVGCGLCSCDSTGSYPDRVFFRELKNCYDGCLFPFHSVSKCDNRYVVVFQKMIWVGPRSRGGHRGRYPSREAETLEP